MESKFYDIPEDFEISHKLTRKLDFAELHIDSGFRLSITEPNEPRLVRIGLSNLHTIHCILQDTPSASAACFTVEPVPTGVLSWNKYEAKSESEVNRYT